MTLPSLLERVDAATGPDRELDRDLYDALCSNATQEWTEWDSRHDFTHSLDTALALVRERLPYKWIRLDIWSDHNLARPCASILPRADEPTDTSSSYGASLPLALLAAMLRALIAKEQEDGR